MIEAPENKMRLFVLMGSRQLAALICLAAATIYFMLSLQFEGPAYLADEIGYLNNAAFIAGHYSDGASSYYAGYSLLISPLFYFFSDAHQVWAGVLVLNGLMWGVTLYLVWSLLGRILPATPSWKRAIVLVVLAAYPAYLTMSGYAFSQTSFAFIFTAALYALVFLDRERSWTVLPHATLVGYLCSIHPAGLAVALASVLSLSIVCWRGKSVSIAVSNALAIGVLIFIYHGLIRPSMIAEMTSPESNAGLHYPGFSAIWEGGQYGRKLKTLLGMVFGQLSYLLIATFGFVAVGAVVGVRQGIRQIKRVGVSGSDEGAFYQAAIPFILVLSILGIIGLSALGGMAGSGPGRLDQWIYGRYVEPVIATLFGIGLLSRSSPGLVVASALSVTFTGALLIHGIEISGPVYSMNVPALWPQFAYVETSPLAWFITGGLGIILMSILNRQLACVLILSIYAFCVPSQQDWHRRVLNYNSTPSDIPQFIMQNYGGSTCVAFDEGSSRGVDGIGRERANMYSFYFFNNPLVRMKPEAWLEHCDGPLLTFNPSLKFPETEYIGREIASNLYVLAKKGRHLVFPMSEPRKQYWKQNQSEECLLAGCFSLQGAELARYSLVGRASSGGIETDGRAGYFLYGPYSNLAVGDYLIDLVGDFSRVEDARLDIVSQGGKIVHFESDLRDVIDATGSRIKVPLSLDDGAQSIEVRIQVSDRDRITLAGYQFQLDNMSQSGRSGLLDVSQEETGFAYQGAALVGLPSQIGEMSRNELSADGREGFLLYGPYRRVGAGSYVLVVRGRSDGVKESWVDVVSAGGRKTYARFPIQDLGEDDGTVLVKAEVVIEEKVKDLEIRIFLAKGDALVVTGYSFEAM